MSLIPYHKDKVYSYLQKHIYVWAEQSFKNDVKIKISVETGSMIVRVRVGGKALVCLLALYGGMRGGIDYLVNDSWTFSDTVIEHFIQDENIRIFGVRVKNHKDQKG